MQVTIKDDFDLEKIIESGQCFRGKCLEDGSYRFISGDSAIYLRPEDRETGVYTVSCDKESWETIWFPIFDLERHLGNASHLYYFPTEKYSRHHQIRGSPVGEIRP